MADDPFRKAIEDELREAAARGGDGVDPIVPSDAPEGPLDHWGRADASGRDGAMPKGRSGVATRPAGVPSVGRRPGPPPHVGPPSPTAPPRADPSLSEEAARAREAPDYVGDFEERGVPRWEPDGATPPASTPPSVPVPAPHSRDDESVPDGRLPERDGAGMLSPGIGNARLCYLFNLAFFLGIVFLPLIGAVMALTSRRKVGADLATHYTYAARTVGLGLVTAFLINMSALSMPDLYGLLALGWLIWFGVRNARGLMRLGAGKAMPNPGTWLF